MDTTFLTITIPVIGGIIVFSYKHPAYGRKIIIPIIAGTALFFCAIFVMKISYASAYKSVQGIVNLQYADSTVDSKMASHFKTFSYQVQKKADVEEYNIFLLILHTGVLIVALLFCLGLTLVFQQIIENDNEKHKNKRPPEGV